MTNVSPPLTSEEESVISIIRINAKEKRIETRKEWRVGKLKAEYSHRSSKNLWGRFGGGWNWKVGVMVGGSTVIVDLLVCSLRFSVTK